MDSLFSKKFEEAKAEALAKLIKRPEELIARQRKWALSSDTYRRWLYLTDFDMDETVEIPVPFLGDDVIDQISWDGREFEVSGWLGTFAVNPIEDWAKGKSMIHGLRVLFPDWLLSGPQLLQYSQDCIQLRLELKPQGAENVTTHAIVRVTLSGIHQFGVFDLYQKFTPDQWYELAALTEGETRFRRFIWTSGTRLQLALVADIQVSWEEAEELDYDLDHLFAMIPWEEGMDEYSMDLFVKTYAEHEGEELITEILEPLEGFLNESADPYLTLAQNFYDLEKSLDLQKGNWENRVELVLLSLRKSNF